MITARTISIGTVVALAGLATADELPLEYNWNGVLHESEAPIFHVNDAMGYRAHGDRGYILGFADSLGGTTGEVTTSYGTYQLHMTANEPDMLFFGTRWRGAGTVLAWDDVADLDNLGTQPAWDPTGGSWTLEDATVTFDTPVVMDANTNISFIYNTAYTYTAGDFDVYLNFSDGSTAELIVHAPDWFANNNPTIADPDFGIETLRKLEGPLSDGDGFYAARGYDIPTPNDPLSEFECGFSTSSLEDSGGFDVMGKTLESITFDAFFLLQGTPNGTSVGVHAMLVNGSPVALPLNWNGMAHAAEMSEEIANMPDGYRSISDRGFLAYGENSINQGGYVFSGDAFDYQLEAASDVVDSIAIGTRGRGWDDVEDMDDTGVAPSWDPTGGTAIVDEWISFMDSPVAFASNTEIGFLYTASNGGGDFTVELTFLDGSSTQVTLNSADWFANGNPVVAAPAAGVVSQAKLAGPLSEGDGYAATSGADRGIPENPLCLFEAVISTQSLLSGLGFDASGKELDYITFADVSLGGMASIFAASIGEGASGPQCSDADFAETYGVLDIDDVLAFLGAFASGDDAADLVDNDVLDIDDVLYFLTAFAAGCP